MIKADVKLYTSAYFVGSLYARRKTKRDTGRYERTAIYKQWYS